MGGGLEQNALFKTAAKQYLMTLVGGGGGGKAKHLMFDFDI